MSQLETKTAFDDKALCWFAHRSNDLFILIDHQAKIRYMNKAFERQLQIEFEELENDTVAALVHEEDKGKTLERFLFLHEQESFSPFTSRWKVSNGTYCLIHWETAQVSKGVIRAIGQPVQQPKKQDKHNKMVNLWRPVFNLMENAGTIIDNDGFVLLVNSTFEKTFGWNAHEIEGKYMPCIPDQYKSEYASIIQTVFNKGETIRQRTWRKKKDGTIIPVNIVVSPLFNRSREVNAISVVTIDLSEISEIEMLVEKQSEEIEVAERLLLDITKNISEVFCLFDLEKGKPVYVSPAMEHKWNIKADNFYENPLSMLDNFRVDYRDNLVSFFFDPFNTARELEVEMIADEKGNSKWIRIEQTPIKDENGNIIRHFSFFKDITELKEKTTQIKQLDQLGVAGRLAAGIAHEIRNPLTAVKGFVQLLAEESHSKYSQIILSEINRIESIMNEFLVLAKPQKEMRAQKENINNIVKDVSSFMTPEALLNNVYLHLDFQKVPFVHCESNQIKQVLINIIKNAIEAMPSGGSIHIKTYRAEDGFASIEIKDEGVGIPKDRLYRLGEPFYSNKEKGTGLGMMISYKIIEDHKGSIQLFSEEGKGTTVQIKLPPH